MDDFQSVDHNKFGQYAVFKCTNMFQKVKQICWKIQNFLWVDLHGKFSQ